MSWEWVVSTEKEEEEEEKMKTLQAHQNKLCTLQTP